MPCRGVSSVPDSQCDAPKYLCCYHMSPGGGQNRPWLRKNIHILLSLSLSLYLALSLSLSLSLYRFPLLSESLCGIALPL